MALDLDKMQTQYDRLLAQVPVTVTYDGTDYAGCTRTNVTVDRLYLDEGRLLSYTFSVFATQALKTADPQVDDKVTIEGIIYRILSVPRDGPNVGLRLDLGREYSQ